MYLNWTQRCSLMQLKKRNKSIYRHWYSLRSEQLYSRLAWLIIWMTCGHYLWVEIKSLQCVYNQGILCQPIIHDHVEAVQERGGLDYGFVVRIIQTLEPKDSTSNRLHSWTQKERQVWWWVTDRLAPQKTHSASQPHALREPEKTIQSLPCTALLSHPRVLCYSRAQQHKQSKTDGLQLQPPPSTCRAVRQAEKIISNPWHPAQLIFQPPVSERHNRSLFTKWLHTSQ